MQAKEELIFTIILVVIVLVFLGILLLVILARHNMRKNRLVHENEKIKREFEQTLLNTRLEIQEQTLTEVSREIHDNIGQTLSLARLHVNTMESAGAADVSSVDDLLGKAITDLRALSHSLNTNNIREIGFVDAVKLLLSQLDKTGKFTTRFIDQHENFSISDDHGLIVYRIIQEALNNIVKHAQASLVTVTLQKQGNNDLILITDNGHGFDASQHKKEGIGLRNIISRAEIIGAKLSVHSQPGQGTTVSINL